MKEYLIEKYEGYIKELELEIETAIPTNTHQISVLLAKAHICREILTDLKML